jgi:hypothetical protein
MAYIEWEWPRSVAQVAFFRSLVDLLNRHSQKFVRKISIIGIIIERTVKHVKCLKHLP